MASAEGTAQEESKTRWSLPTGANELQKYDAGAGSVRLMGDPVLRKVSIAVDPASAEVAAARKVLHATLRAFRKKWGFGRGISAVQIGYAMRMIALNLGDERGAFTMHNPVITWKSDEMFTMYDDCMSFPDLLVRVRRHKSISVSYVDDDGKECEMNKLDQATSELLQHEIDHCDGILSVDIAHGDDGVIYRSVYEANKVHFDSQVDYFIVPTIEAATA